MAQRLFMTAAGQSICASPINNSQTTVVLTSTSGFPVPLSFQQFSAIMLDSGNPAWNKDLPLATPYEYVFVTGNNTGTNTLTIVRGQEGTTGHAFFAGATVAGILLPSDLTASFEQKIGENTLGGLSTTLGTFTIPAGYKGLTIKGKAQGNGATVDIALQFNGDTTNSYSNTQLFATSATPQSSGPTVGSYALLAQAVSGSAAVWVATLMLPNDTILANKPIISHWSTQGEVGIRAGYWNQTAQSITTVTVISSGNCISGSYVEVFGTP
jgi:hypothetical protein